MCKTENTKHTHAKQKRHALPGSDCGKMDLFVLLACDSINGNQCNKAFSSFCYIILRLLPSQCLQRFARGSPCEPVLTGMVPPLAEALKAWWLLRWCDSLTTALGGALHRPILAGAPSRGGVCLLDARLSRYRDRRTSLDVASATSSRARPSAFPVRTGDYARLLYGRTEVFCGRRLTETTHAPTRRGIYRGRRDARQRRL